MCLIVEISISSSGTGIPEHDHVTFRVFSTISFVILWIFCAEIILEVVRNFKVTPQKHEPSSLRLDRSLFFGQVTTGNSISWMP